MQSTSAFTCSYPAAISTEISKIVFPMRKRNPVGQEHFFLQDPYVEIFEENYKGLLFIQSGMEIMQDIVKVCTVHVIL